MRRPPPLVGLPLAVPLMAGLVPGQMPSKELAHAAAGYAAKVAASALFVSGRTLDDVRREELAPVRAIEKLIQPLLQFEVDADQRTVTVRLGQARAVAACTGELGCVLLPAGGAVDAVRARETAVASDRWPAADEPWPLGERVEPATGDFDGAKLAAALDRAFAEHDPERPNRSRAVVVLHRGQLVAERYASGYRADQPLPGWSMSKSLTCALLGMRVAEGRLDLDAPPKVEAWQQDGDPRAAITMRHLLTMTAGLAWNEDYDDAGSDCLRMLFGAADFAALYADLPTLHPPGQRFCYASGATNLLCRLLRDTFDDDDEYRGYPRRLFRQLGMRTAVLEADPSGTFVGSSYGFASARDWARLGLLFARDGVFDGRRILPAGWVAAATTATAASGGRYGWQLWLNADPDGDGAGERQWPDLPADLFHMDGHDGQYCVVSPGAELVIVRLGCTKNGGFPLRAFLRDVHAAMR